MGAKKQKWKAYYQCSWIIKEAGLVVSLPPGGPVPGTLSALLGLRAQLESSFSCAHQLFHLLLLLPKPCGSEQRPGGEARRAGHCLSNWHYHQLASHCLGLADLNTALSHRE